jgi:hypothetical protein
MFHIEFSTAPLQRVNAAATTREHAATITSDSTRTSIIVTPLVTANTADPTLLRPACALRAR